MHNIEHLTSVFVQDQCREGKQTGDAERLKSPDAPTLELGTRTFCTLSAAYLQDIVKGFPCPLLCAEGSSWCVTTVDYSALERADEATKFTLAVCNSPNADLAKELLIEREFSTLQLLCIFTFMFAFCFPCIACFTVSACRKTACLLALIHT